MSTTIYFRKLISVFDPVENSFVFKFITHTIKKRDSICNTNIYFHAQQIITLRIYNNLNFEQRKVPTYLQSSSTYFKLLLLFCFDFRVNDIELLNYFPILTLLIYIALLCK